jgi:hypothetical protein
MLLLLAGKLTGWAFFINPKLSILVKRIKAEQQSPYFCSRDFHHIPQADKLF